MEGTFLDFFIYLVTNIHKDKNAFFIISFVIIGSFFTIRLLLRNSDLILGLIGNLIALFFIIFVIFILYVFIGIPLLENQ